MGLSDALFELLRFEMDGTKCSSNIDNLMISDSVEKLFKLSKQHDLAHLVGDALDKNDLLPDGSEIKKRFLRERNMAVYRYEQMQYEIEQICDTLEKAKIPFIPLKGAVIRDYYPEPWMRTSCDVDILVKEEDLPVAIDVLTRGLNYRYERTGSHDAHLFAENGVHLELHYKLNDGNQKWDHVLARVWEYSSAETDYRYALTKEMFYLYHITHMAGHFKVGGCGIRPFLDLSLLRKYNVYNQEILSGLLQQAGLAAFNEAVCGLAEYWFADGQTSTTTQTLAEFILNSGMYGDMKNRVAIEKNKKGGIRFLFSRIFLSYNELKFKYPKLQKRPILFPFYQVKRWFNLLKKDRRKKSLQELSETTRGDVKRQERVAKLLKDLDL